jgi:hypothetical protein
MRGRRAVTRGATWSRHPISQCPIGVPYEVLKFAPKKVRSEGVPREQSGSPIVEMLQSADQQLRAAENRLNQLETEIERVQDRASRKRVGGERAPASLATEGPAHASRSPRAVHSK